MKTAILENNNLLIRFNYDPTIVSLVKSFSNRSYDPITKTWTSPISSKNIEKLMGNGFVLDKNILKWYEERTTKKENKITNIPGLLINPYPFQIEGINFIEERKGRCLVADDMGLGKTLQAIAYLQLHPELRPAVIVCPASVKESWVRSCVKWMTNETIVCLSGKPNGKDILTQGTLHNSNINLQFPIPKEFIYIINYDIFGNKIITKTSDSGRKTRIEEPYIGWIDPLLDINPKAFIIDEAHYIKNEKAQRSIAVKKAAKKCQCFISLTGTPITSKPVEFWPILSMTDPGTFRNFFKFAKKYCDAKQGHFGWDFSGSSNEAELNELLKETIMIRRMKMEVLKDLPSKTRTVVPLSLTDTQKKKYRALEREIESWAQTEESKNQAAALTRIELLKQMAVSLKMELAITWIEDFLESSQKLVLFVDHHSTADAIREHFCKITKVAEVTGQTKGSRQDQVDIFQNDPKYRLFLGSKSAREGITLTAASNVAFLELFWNSIDHDQAEDRVLRIGQESETMNAWYLLAAETIEEEIATLLDRKRTVLAEVLDGKKVQDFDLLTSLLDKIKQRSIL